MEKLGGIERERKFKLIYLPEGLPSVLIRQGYLMLEDGKQLRVRLINDTIATMAYKETLSETDKFEYEFQVSLEDAKVMLSTCKRQVNKLRYHTEFNGNHVDIDVYSDKVSIVEIEYEGEEIGELPDYCGEEVTKERKYSNIYMAINGIPEE